MSQNKGHRYQKGNKYGKGRPKLSMTSEMIQHTLRQDVIAMVEKCRSMTKIQMESRSRESEVTLLELAILSALSHSITNGDTSRLDAILNRVIGKPKESVELSGRLDSRTEVTLYSAWGSAKERPDDKE